MRRPILTFLSPTLEADDVTLAIKMLIAGGKGNETRQVEKWMEEYLGSSITAVAFNAGRSALWALLKAFGIGCGDEVVVQGFTCIAVTNSIRWLGAKPVYCDIEEESFNLNIKQLEKKITNSTKAIIVQHTFGRPAEINEIARICRKYKLVLIEDCAHALGGNYKGRKLGTLGDGAIFSFGRDKLVSSVYGGVAVTKTEQIGNKLRDIELTTNEAENRWVIQQLWHPILSWIVIYTYRYGLGKLIHKMIRKWGILSPEVYREEKRGIKPKCFPAKLDNRLAALALRQLTRLEVFNEKRRKLAEGYGERWRDGSVYMLIPKLVNNRDEILQKAKTEMGWVLGDWYRQVVTPALNDAATGYKLGECPVAESTAKRVINLPTCPFMDVSQAVEIKHKVELWSK